MRDYLKALAIASATGLVALAISATAQVSNGRVTTAAPTYSNNSTAPLSLDTAGNLRIVGSISATTEADASATPPSYSPGLEPLSQTLSGELRVLPTPNGTQDVDVTATVGLTDTELRASAVDVAVTGVADVDVTATVGLTDTELRASPVPIDIQPSTSYGSASGSGTTEACVLVKASPGYVTSIYGGGTEASSHAITIRIRDNAAGTATGTIIYSMIIPFFAANLTHTETIAFTFPIEASAGVTACSVSSSGAGYHYVTATAY